jgi:hypothetical protein
MKKLFLVLSIFILVLLPMAAIATTITYDFYAISTNNPTDCATGAAQFKMDVSDSGSNVVFKLYNTGPLSSSMTQFYFMDNTVGGLLVYPADSTPIGNGPGVNIVYTATGNLPGISDYLGDFPAVNYRGQAASQGGVPANGVQSGEYVNFTFALSGAHVFADVITALNFGPNLPVGGFLVGVHGQSLAPGLGSCSYVQMPQTPIPGSLLLLSSGVLGLIGLRRKLQ